MRAVHVEGLPSEPRGRLARTGDHMSLLGEHMHVGINDACPLEAGSTAAHLPVSGRAWRAEVSTWDAGSSDVLSAILILFLVETKVFSGSREKQQEGAHVTVSASPVEQKLVEDPLPDGSSSPSNSCQSSDLSEPAESQQQSLPKLSFPLPGSLCPFQDLCTSLQEDHSVQIEREFLEGKEWGRYRVEMILP